MISTLLFLTSIELHIHTEDAAVKADHGFAVSISSIAGDLNAIDTNDKIKVSPDSVLKLKQSDINLLVIFLLVSIIIVIVNQT